MRFIQRTADSPAEMDYPDEMAVLGKRQCRQDQEVCKFYIAYHALGQHEHPAGWMSDSRMMTLTSLLSFPGVMRGWGIIIISLILSVQEGQQILPFPWRDGSWA